MVGSVELWFAFAAWTTVLVGMVRHVTRTVFLPAAGTPSRARG
jgi:hypothetical protein